MTVNLREIEGYREGDRLRITDPANEEAWIVSDRFVPNKP